MSTTSVLLLCIIAALCCVQLTLSAEVMIPMRDGVKLHTYLDFPLTPDPPKNMTVVMDRSPYGADATEMIADIYTLFGFVAVRQDMRGTKQSEGNFTLWHNASTDAYDTMKWISEQEWSSGVVFTVGASADGIAEFAQVLASPPWLKAQVIVFATAQGREVIFPGGAYREALISRWLHGTVPKQADYLIHWTQENEGPGAWWNPINDTGHYHQVTFPSVMWAGWYDIFLMGNLKGFYGYQHLSLPEHRGQSRIVVDPLGHCQKAHKYFPKNLIEGRIILPLLDSIDLYKGKKPAEDSKAVTFYIMGADNITAPGNYWTTLDDWPAFKPVNMYFHEDGTMSDEPPKQSNSSTTYKYDPSNPVPTIGGANLEIECGPLDQRPVEGRDDVLVFTTDVLQQPIAVTGPLVAHVYVSSDAKDTDFTGKISDVYPSGESRIIQDGILRMRWRDGTATPLTMQKGVVYPVDILLWNTSYVFNTGHKIRVAISSSNYPRFNANPNTGLPMIKNGTVPPVVAHNTLHHSTEYPSHLTLPVISLDECPEHGFLLDDMIEARIQDYDPDTQRKIKAKLQQAAEHPEKVFPGLAYD